ncbi:pyridoxamine 5'-phosphate oxidase family protein [Halorubrum sp. DTA98]|uniref:pyridoxamine 5'-phosphate oxidase family protein n=1 Tax=Halorubrum sp. DTA98 TaxID=3402163 RepID=UPI003AAA342B
MSQTDGGSDDVASGPALHLESESLDPTEAFCTEVFDETDRPYRVVQFTTAQSFDELRDALDAQLREINDPSEAAVIIMTPRADEESESSEVGEGTPLYASRVDPQDLTGISVAFSRLLEHWEDGKEPVRICLRDLESLLPYHDSDLIYRFLNTVLATLQGAGADVHAHLDPAGIDDATLHMLTSLFAHVVEDGDTIDDTTTPSDDAGATRPGSEPNSSASESNPNSSPADPDVARTATMTDAEIDAFLAEQGYGTLAFGGDPPYAVPMSYGYDPDERVAYTHMSRFEGSEKRARLDESASVSLVVSRYERPDRWRSVVVVGSLTRLSAEEVRSGDALTVFANSELASVDVFSRDPSTVEFDWYVLEPTEITGRRSAGSM